MARRRRNIKDLLTPDPTPDRQLTHPSGWCMTADHDKCKYQFDHGRCGCSCGHKGKIKENQILDNSSDDSPVVKRRGRPPKNNPTVKENANIIDKQDPRPWKQK